MTLASDPWRLCCPDCGGHSLRSYSDHWLCQECDGDRKDELKDKATGRLVSRSEVAA